MTHVCSLIGTRCVLIVTPTTTLTWWVTIETPVAVEHGWLVKLTAVYLCNTPHWQCSHYMAHDIHFVEFQLVQISIANTHIDWSSNAYVHVVFRSSSHMVACWFLLCILLLWTIHYTQEYIWFQCHLKLTLESPQLYNPTHMLKHVHIHIIIARLDWYRIDR